MSDYNLGTASGRIQVDGSGAQAGFNVALRAAEGFQGAIQKQVDAIQNFGKAMAGVGAAGLGAFGLAVSAAADFEKGMSAVEAVSGAQGKQLDDLRAKAIALGRDTVFTTTESTKAIEELVKAGISIEDVLNGAADATVALAAAGGISLPEAATIAANSMNQFELSGKQVVDVADLLAGAANTSAADVSTLGQSLQQVGAVANISGISLEDTVTSLGLLADAGIQGSDAGTSLKTMLLNLNPVTKRQIELFTELGLITKEGKNQFIGANGAIKPMAQVAEILNKTLGFTSKEQAAVNKAVKGGKDPMAALEAETGKMGAAQRLANLEILFGSDAIRAAAIVAKNGAKGYEEFATAAGKVSAADVARQRLENLSGAIDSFKGSIEAAAISIGGPLLGPLTKLVKGLTFLVNKFGELPEPVLKAISYFGAAVALFLLVSGAGLALIPVIAGMALSFLGLIIVRSLIAPVITFGVALVRYRSFAVAASLANAKLTQSMLLLARTFRLSAAASLLAGRANLRAASNLTVLNRTTRVAAVGAKIMAVAMRILSFAFSGPGLIIFALVAALVILYKRFAPFRAIVDQVGAALLKLGQAIANGVMALGGKAWTAIVAGAKELWSYIGATLIPAFNELKATLAGVGSSGVGDFFRLIGQYAVIAGAAIKTGFSAVMGFLAPILPILGKIALFLGGVFLASIVSGFKGVVQVITGVVKIISGIVKVFQGIFTGDFSLIWEGLKQIVSGALGAILGIIRVWLAVSVLKLFALGFALLRGIFMLGWNLIKMVFQTALTGILAVIRTNIAVWRAVFTAIWGAIRAVFTAVWGFLKAVVAGGIRGILTVIKTYVKIWVTIFKTVWNAIKAVFKGAIPAILGFIRSMVTGLVNLIKGGVGKAKAAATAIANGIRTAITALIAKAKTWGKDIITGFIGGILAMVKKVSEAAQKVAKAVADKMPGSPVKEGPLKAWNRGAAGKKLMQMLTEGIQAEQSSVVKAAQNVAASIYAIPFDLPGVSAGLTMSAVGTAPASIPPGMISTAGQAVATKSPKQPAGQRLIGTLDLTSKSSATIKGITNEVVESDEDFEKVVNRMGKPS